MKENTWFGRLIKKQTRPLNLIPDLFKENVLEKSHKSVMAAFIVFFKVCGCIQRQKSLINFVFLITEIQKQLSPLFYFMVYFHFIPPLAPSILAFLLLSSFPLRLSFPSLPCLILLSHPLPSFAPPPLIFSLSLPSLFFPSLFWIYLFYLVCCACRQKVRDAGLN